MESHAAYFKLSLAISDVLEEHERKFQLALPRWVTPISDDVFAQPPGSSKKWRFPFPTDRLSPFGASFCLLVCGAAFLIYSFASLHSNASYRVIGNTVDGCLLMLFGALNIWLLRRERHHRLKVTILALIASRLLLSHQGCYSYSYSVPSRNPDFNTIDSRSTRPGCA